jgi:hypothetical protein
MNMHGDTSSLLTSYGSVTPGTQTRFATAASAHTSSLAVFPNDLSIAEAIRGVVIDQAACLHVRIHDRASDKPESTPLEIRAEGVRIRCRHGDLPQRPTPVENGSPADESPAVVIEAAELFLHHEKGARVADCRLDFQAVADDAIELQQSVDLVPAVTRHSARIKTREGGSIARPPLEDGGPAQAGLGALEEEELEMVAVVVNGHTPFHVMILFVGREGVAGPLAADRTSLSHAFMTAAVAAHSDEHNHFIC